MQILKIKGK